MDIKRISLILVTVVTVWALGVAFGYIDALGLGPLSIALFTVAIVTFLGILRSGGDMRTAIAASFVVIYFAFLAALSTSERNRAELDTVVGQEVWTNFTYLVGVIVVFYFGSTAAVEISRHIQGSATTDDPSTHGTGAGTGSGIKDQ